MALEPAKLSDFVMTRALGTGTTAKVFEATHRSSGRQVAIKVMALSSPQLQAQASEMRERFAREALLLADVDSRYVGKIIGYGFDKGEPFLVLEYLEGETLDAKLRRDGAMPAAVAAPWMEQLIVGVRDCHDANVIHRDIKPSNIFLHHERGAEEVKLIDFGVARLREIAGDMASSALTTAGHLIGSMGYMAPEQFKNPRGVGFQTDLYAIGVVIYRTLTGRLPFVSRSIDAILNMKTERPPPQISAVPGALQNALLDAFVQRSMQREPEARFRNARDMLEQWWGVMRSLGADASPAEGPASLDERTIQSPPAEHLSGITAVERPMRFGSVDPEAFAGDTPTGDHPALRLLVERELELEKERKRKG
jgi:serine/threonine-protein kinase